MWTLLLTLVTTAATGRAALVPGVQTTEDFHQDAVLDADGNFLLFWKFNDTHVTFEAHVKTKGMLECFYFQIDRNSELEIVGRLNANIYMHGVCIHSGGKSVV